MAWSWSGTDLHGSRLARGGRDSSLAASRPRAASHGPNLPKPVTTADSSSHGPAFANLFVLGSSFLVRAHFCFFFFRNLNFSGD